MEQNKCVSNQKSCSSMNKLGSQLWSNNNWSNCKTCAGGYTAFSGQCFENWFAARYYTSYLTNCWHDGIISCPNQLIEGMISAPSVYAATSSQKIEFTIFYTRASKVNLSEKHVLIDGTATSSCKKSISGTGLVERKVMITGCSGIGNIRITIAAGSATHVTGASLGEFGPSPNVMIVNKNSFPIDSTIKTSIHSYTGSNGSQINFELSKPSDYQSRKNIPILIWIHGGSWVAGSYKDESALAQSIAKLGFVVVNVNYTLAKFNSVYPTLKIPNSPYSIGPNDINRLVQFVKDHYKEVNGNINNISIGGGSAGGHLTMLQATRSDNPINFKCVLAGSAPSDLNLGVNNQNYPYTSWIFQSIFGRDAKDLSYFSPSIQVTNLRAEKLALFHQIRDNLVPIEQTLQMSYQVKTKASNVDLFQFYGFDENQIIYKPEPSQVTHLYNDTALLLASMKAFLYTECR